MVDQKTLREYLMAGSFSAKVKELVLELLPYLEKQHAPGTYMRVRRALNELKNKTKDKEQRSVCEVVLFLLKKQHGWYIEPRDPHVVSDHAFCTAMRRYMGADLKPLKDEILQLAEKHNWPAVYKDGTILTFLPKFEEAA